jgi:hypothetical protein
VPEPLNDGDQILEREVQSRKIGNRTESAALLAWFLESVLRIDPDEVSDSICDGGGDKGIDAIVVDDDASEIIVLQSKYRVNPDVRTQGDSDIRNLVGASAWLRSAQSVDDLLASGPNPELRKLLSRQEIRERVSAGNHLLRLVFVTNASLDGSGSDYAEMRAAEEPRLEVWDRTRLTEVAHRTERPALVPSAHSLTSTGTPIVVDLTSEARMAVCLVPAKELVALPGIEDRSLFSRNVRLYAGSTRINRDLRKTVTKLEEHRLFPAYHNGLTLLTEKISAVEGAQVTLDSVGVVNGCQSLITLYDNRESITDELRVLVKIVEVASDDKVADLITYRSNNQNAVTMRDQRSSEPVMRDLKQAIADTFGDDFAIITRVGERVFAKAVIENTLVAQLVMAIYLAEPWSAVRKVRLFDQDFRRIFGRQVTPHAVYLLYLIDQAVMSERHNLRPDLRSSFASIRFTLDYLVSVVLRLNEVGSQLLSQPEAWLPVEGAAVSGALARIAHEVVDSANYHVASEVEENENYDPKVVFKSQRGVARLVADAERDAKRQAGRTTSYLFTVTPSETR